MIHDFEDFCTYVFVIVDDILQRLSPVLKRPGPAPECSDSELLTMALVGECRGWDLETELLSCWHSHRDLFPVIPSQSRFNRRRRYLHQAFNQVRQAVLQAMRIMGSQYVLGRTIHEGLEKGRANNRAGTRWNGKTWESVTNGEGTKTGKGSWQWNSQTDGQAEGGAKWTTLRNGTRTRDGNTVNRTFDRIYFVSGIYPEGALGKTTDQGQCIYVDTPGIHRRGGKALNRYLNRTAQTALALRYYLIGMLCAAVDQPLVFAFYARQDTLRPALVGILGVGIYLLVAMPTHRTLGMVGTGYMSTISSRTIPSAAAAIYCAS